MTMPTYPNTPARIEIGHHVEVDDDEKWIGRVVGIRLPIGGERADGENAQIEVWDRTPNGARTHHPAERLKLYVPPVDISIPGELADRLIDLVEEYDRGPYTCLDDLADLIRRARRG